MFSCIAGLRLLQSVSGSIAPNLLRSLQYIWDVHVSWTDVRNMLIIQHYSDSHLDAMLGYVIPSAIGYGY